MAVPRALVAALVVWGGLWTLAATAVAQDQPAAASRNEAVNVDQGAIIEPRAMDSPTPTPTATPTPSTAPGESTPEPVETPGGDNAALRPTAVKQHEARTRCAPTTSRLLATGGSERIDRERSWAWLPFLVAAVCAALVLGALVLRRSRAARTQQRSAGPSLLEVVATLVGISAGLAGLAAQFVPGVGAHEAPAPAAKLEVRSVNARITREEFARRNGLRPPRSDIDRREVGNVIWLQIHLTGYRGKTLQLQWGSYESKAGGSLVAATTHETPLVVDSDSDEQTRFQPIWVGYPDLSRFLVQFRLLENGEVRELASTGPMRGRLARYACATRE